MRLSFQKFISVCLACVLISTPVGAAVLVNYDLATLSPTSTSSGVTATAITNTFTGSQTGLSTSGVTNHFCEGAGHR